MAFLSQLVLASNMVKSGYIPKIISSETGLSLKQLRRLYKELSLQDLFLVRSKPGKDPSGSTLIKNLRLKIHASVAMKIYCIMGEKIIHNTVSHKALSAACYMYQAVFFEINKNPVLDINDLWYLAQEIRDGHATVEDCECCGYGYYHSIHQRMNADCPFCNKSQIMRKKTG